MYGDGASREMPANRITPNALWELAALDNAEGTRASKCRIARGTQTAESMELIEATEAGES